MKLFELFDKNEPFEWTEQSSSRWQAQFFIEDFIYEVNFDFQKTKLFNKDFWLIEFRLVNKTDPNNDGYGIEDTGNANLVFGTVLKIIFDFIKHAQPKMIKFEAKEPSRKKLYTTLVKKLASPKWKIKSFEIQGQKIFEIAL
jgi:hypothetical protein